MELDMGYNLGGRVAIVTGGGTGIGAATAKLLAKYGADVVIAARTVEDLEKTAAEVEGSSDRRCLIVPTDVKNEEQCGRLINRTMEEFGKIDILINNAGGTRMGGLKDLPTKGWDATFDLNVRSAYFTTREAGKHMIDAGSGAIVNISSGAGVNGVKGGAHYSASKAALQMFTTVTAAEWGRYGIRANCIAVGGITSERVLEAWSTAGIDPATIGQGSALGRTGTPEEVARTIAFFVSDASSYISGQTLLVDGGSVLGGPPDL